MVMFVLILILLYSVSLALYMVNMLKGYHHYGIWAYRFLLMGGSFHTFTFAIDLIKQDYFPLLTMFEVLFFYSLALIILTLMIHHVFKWKLLEMLIVFMSLIILIGAVSIGDTSPSIHSTLLSRLVLIHIVFSVISYSAFSLSAIFSMLFIIQDYLLKRKIWNRFTKALPSLESLDRSAYYANLVGIPMLLIGLIIGSAWASIFLKWTFFFDPKVIISFVVLFMYSWSVIKRQKKTWLNKQVAIWNLFSFIMVVINFSIVNVLGSFHRWL